MTEISTPFRLKPIYNTIDPPNMRIRKSRMAKQTLVSNYQLGQVIGIGGFAKVFRAVHIPTGQTVAAKVVNLRKLSDSKRNDLEREIEIHRNLMHQNIAQLYEVHEENDKMYIFMEFCFGGELFDYINEYGALSQNRARKIFKQIYSAVCYLHQNFIAHRDIKTQNILLDQKGNAKLIDFGLSSYYGLGTKNQFLDTFCGSPSYLAPQMIKRNKYEPKMIDVWCLGITLYAMVKAELPFYHSNSHEQNKKIESLNYVPTGQKYLDDLLSQIFVPVSHRISLQQIKNSDFLTKDKEYCPNCLSFQAQNYAIDQQIVDSIQRDFRISSKKIIQSIKEKKLDNQYGLYYLILQKNRSQGHQSCYDIRSSSFLKGRDFRSLRKREKIPQIKKKQSQKTTASTPKSLRSPLNLVSLEKKRLNIFEDKILSPMVESTEFSRKKLEGKMTKRVRRNSDDSPTHYDRLRISEKPRQSRLKHIQI